MYKDNHSLSPEEIAKYESILTSEPTQFEQITLNKYIDVWACAYRSILSCPSASNRLPDAMTLEDYSLFEQYNSGQLLFPYNDESEEDFWLWASDNHPYHCMDILHNRIYLEIERSGARRRTGPYYFRIMYYRADYWEATLRAIEALYNKGIVLMCPDAEDILSFLKESLVV